MKPKIYNNYQKFDNLNENKLKIMVFKSNSSDDKYYMKSLFLDLYNSEFESYEGVLELVNNIHPIYKSYLNNFYHKNLGVKLTGSKRIHLCFGTEKVLSELKEKTQQNNSELSDIIHIRDGKYKIDNFSPITSEEIDRVMKLGYFDFYK